MNKLPSYYDDEVTSYHPLCEYVLQKALIKCELDKEYEVVHHDDSLSIIPDFVIKNKKTRKILLVIEVKKTPAHVFSLRYKNQAKNYITETKQLMLERPYYILTNLEVTNFFKYDEKIPSVDNQLLEPSPINVGKFGDDYNIFLNSLIEEFTELIKIAYYDKGLKSTNYSNIKDHFLINYTDESNWNASLTVVGYIYIKELFSHFKRKEVTLWKPAPYYRNIPHQINNLISTIDFEWIRKNKLDGSNNIWQGEIIKDSISLAKKTLDGDALTDILFNIVTSSLENNDGVVATDMDLASILSTLLYESQTIKNDELIVDPAAGSGNLLTAFIKNFNIQPKNLWANDIVPEFAPILNLRLGLKYPTLLTNENAPKITNNDVIDFDKNDFNNVKIVSMNPPYISGVQDSSLKKKIIARLKEVKTEKIYTDVGQMSSEGPFLELITHLCKPGTIIGVIFPESHLFSKGKEGASIRKFLLEEFGLKKIFMYPRDGIFKKVTKGTVILIGEAKIRQRNVTVQSSYSKVEDLNLSLLNTDEENGTIITEIDENKLFDNIENGWKFFLFPLYESILEELSSKTVIINSKMLSRGPIGNSGGTDFLFPTKNKNYQAFASLIPPHWLSPAIENTIDSSVIFLKKSDSRIKMLTPPEEAFIEGTNEFILLNKILDEIILFSPNTKKIQNKKEKSRLEIIKIIERSLQKPSKKGTILIPRNLRKEFKYFILEDDFYVSSNFIQIKVNSLLEQQLISSWLNSIFGQIQLEYLTKPQEGARKMEKNNLQLLRIPNINLIDDNLKNHLSFRNFTNFSTTTFLDEYWKNQLNINDSDFSHLQTLFSEMINIRNP